MFSQLWGENILYQHLWGTYSHKNSYILPLLISHCLLFSEFRIAWFFSFPICTTNNTFLKISPDGFFPPSLPWSLHFPKFPTSCHHTWKNLYYRCQNSHIQWLAPWPRKKDFKTHLNAPLSSGETAVYTFMMQDMKKEIFLSPSIRLEAWATTTSILTSAYLTP